METEYKKSMRRQDIYSESGCEYVLPDYNSDVRKILFSDARVRPAGKFTGDDETEFTGVVVYNVIYSDSEGRIGGTTFTSDYEFSLKNSSLNIENVISDTRVGNFALRLVNPRKLSAKCSLVSSISTVEKMFYSPSGTAFTNEEETETQKEKIHIKNTVNSEIVEREYAELICRLDGAIEDEINIVLCKAEIIPEELTVQGNEVLISAELVMSCVIENGEAPAYLCEKRKKIEESVPVNELSEEMILRPVITVSSERSNVRADEDGCEIVMDVIADFSILAESNESLEIIKDAFSTKCAVENSYGDIEYTKLISTSESDEKHSAQIKRSDAADGVIREVIFVSADAKIESVEKLDDKLKIKGEIKYSGVASEINDDGSVSYSSIKISSPFDQNVNIDCQNPKNTRVDVRCTAVNSEVSVDANNLYVSSTIKTKASIFVEESAKALLECSLREEEMYEKDDAIVTVYYPDNGETLFSVAKRFHTNVGRICENNSLALEVSLSDTNSIPVTKKLLIY